MAKINKIEKSPVDDWQYRGQTPQTTKFAIVVDDLGTDKYFNSLSYAAQSMYYKLLAFSHTDEQRSTCFKVLSDYNAVLNMGYNEETIRIMAYGNKHNGYKSEYFVFTKEDRENHGFKPSYTNKIFKELIEKGFIEIKYQGKGKYNGWDKNVTVYEFSHKWKKQK